MENEPIQTAEQMVLGPRRRARRRGQAGSIFRRGLNWTVVYRTPDGRQKWEGGFHTKEEAQKQLGTILGNIRENRYVEPKDIPFREFCDIWMKKSKSILKPKTWASYQSALNRWIVPNSDERRRELARERVTILGDWPICDISRSAVKSFVDQLLGRPELSRKFVKNVVILLHRLLKKRLTANT
jgi:hypothetical protein